MRFLTKFIVIIVLLAESITVSAQQPSPFIDQITAPLTDSELGGTGCLVASIATGGALVYLMGGFSRIAASMQGVMPPLRVMEGGAAVSFIFSSVCYIGAALAPMAMMSYNLISDSFTMSTFPSFTDYEAMIMGKPANTEEVPAQSSP